MNGERAPDSKPPLTRRSEEGQLVGTVTDVVDRTVTVVPVTVVGWVFVAVATMGTVNVEVTRTSDVTVMTTVGDAVTVTVEVVVWLMLVDRRKNRGAADRIALTGAVAVTVILVTPKQEQALLYPAAPEHCDA